MKRENTMLRSIYIVIVLGAIALLGAAVLLMYHMNRVSPNGHIFYISKREGYYGLFERHGRSEKTIFNSGDILQVYPNLARYHISYDVSADGRYVVYSAVNVLGDSDIFLYDRESGKSSNLSNDTHTDTYPVFSHDGEWIAYLSHEKSGRRYDEIFLIKRNGSERIRLTNLLLKISSLSFSPDDRSILFAKHFGDRSSIATLDIESGEIRELNKPFCLNLSPSFSSKGDRIVYISDCHDSLDVWIMNSDGSGRKPLYKGAGDEHEPHFIKGDDSVVFISVSEENADGAPVSFSLLSVGLDDSRITNLIPHKFQNRHLFISHLDMPQPQNFIYFQGKMLDGRRNALYTVFSLDIERGFMRQVGTRGIDILDPVVR